MNDKLKPKLVFVGYKQQYEKLEIDVLSSDYEKHHIFLSKWLVKLVSFLFFYSKKHYHEAYGAIIRRKIKALNGFDVIFTTDSLRDIKSISKVDGRKVIVFRNVTDGSLNHHLKDFETEDRNFKALFPGGRGCRWGGVGSERGNPELPIT